MPINFYSLEKSEFELKQSFLEFLSMCYEFHIKAYQLLEKGNISKEEVIDMEHRKIKAKAKKNDIKDDCIWIISKDQPRANHLRFIVAILYASRDLERIAEQAYNIISYAKDFWDLEKEEYIKSFKKIVLSCFQNCNTFFKNILTILKSDTDYANYVEEVKNLIREFREKFKRILKSDLKNFSLSPANQVEFIFSFSFIIKYIDRTIDHLWSIYDNFLNIKNRE